MLKRFLMAAFGAAILCSCSHRLTLMTWNVGAFDKYGDSRELVATVIRHTEADLVALNELDSCNRRHGIFQLDDLARRLAYSRHFASAFPFAGGAYGNGVLARQPLLRQSHIALPQLDGYEPRSVAVVETAEAVFASVHLDVSSKDAALHQAERINAWFEAEYGGSAKPVFLCGDMNSLPESRTIAELEKHWERLSPLSPTYPSAPAEKCIDYIFRLRSARKVTVLEALRLDESIIGGISLASDHLPLLVQIRYR